MNKVFSNNLDSLRHVNALIAVFVAGFSLFPIFYERDIGKAAVYFTVAFVALLLFWVSNYMMQKADIKNRYIYILSVLFYANILLFGIYLSVWSNPDDLASIFYCFLICTLLLFVNSPVYSLCVTLCTLAIFIVSTIIVKNIEVWAFDVINSLISGIMSLYFSWQIAKLRLGNELSTSKLEDERNRYYNQSTIDELTQLRNRRDFMQTFQRYLVNYRSTDDWLCIAIADIDFFKNYNDHYGHPRGDDCLRLIGGVLNSLKESLGVYSARVGGEEFALLWFEKDTSHIKNVVSYLTELIYELKISHEKSKASPYVTLSIGIYVERCGSHNDVQTLYDLTDKALYTAKGSGRNCAIVKGSEIKQYKIDPSNPGNV
jgi:diguanylate cyclase (GGDEF)-like protein